MLHKDFDLLFDIKTEEQLKDKIIEFHMNYFNLLEICKNNKLKIEIHSEYTDYGYSEGNAYVEIKETNA